MAKIRTILMGTPWFAENIFRKACPELKSRGFDIITVITAEDKPVGRKQVLTPSPIKKWAMEINLPVLQPDKIRNPKWVEKIKELKPELIILTAYGQIIPQKILDIPKYKAINIHPSLLPKYRGASPIQSVILNGETETGVCLMIMDAEMDHGPILGISKFQILNPKISHTELSKELSDLSTELLIKTLPDYIGGKIEPQEQNHAQATFCKLIRKEDGKIDWNKSAIEIERQIRAFKEWPTCYAEIKNEKLKIKNDNLKLKILEAETINPSTTDIRPSSVEVLGAGRKIGEVFLDENKPARQASQPRLQRSVCSSGQVAGIAGGNLCVQTNNGILILKTIQLEGKKPMTAKDYLNGHPEIIGSILS